MRRLVTLLLLSALTLWAQTWHPDGVRPTPPTHIPLPGSAFQALPTRDGRWIFASLAVPDTGKPGLAVLERTGTSASLVRVVPLEDSPAGMVFTHDEALLIVAANERLAFVDVGRLIAGSGDAVLGYLVESGPRLGRVYVNITRDDRFVFASDERARTITVVDLAKARASGFGPSSIIGKIPVGNSPIDLAFSPDGRRLYATSQSAQTSFGWPIVCPPDGAKPGDAPTHAEGTITIVDVERATTDPASSVVGTVAAGCNPVRLVLSPKGDVAYVSARGMNALLAFDTTKLLGDPAHARIGAVPVGNAPVGVALFDSGRRVLVTSSNRFATSAEDHQSVFVIDAARVSEGVAAVMGTIPAGAFPREMRVTADEKTLLLTNFASKTLEIVDLTRLPLEPRLR